MGTSTRKISKRSRTRTSTRIKSPSKPAGRRGGATRSIHVAEINIPDAALSSRAQAFIIDMLIIILIAELLYFREVYHLYDAKRSTFTAVAVIYLASYLMLYIFPMRFFGQSIGMKIKKIKILRKIDLEFVKITQLLQRQTVGLFLSITAGIMKLVSERKLLADEVFKTVVTYVHKENNEVEEKK